MEPSAVDFVPFVGPSPLQYCSVWMYVVDLTDGPLTSCAGYLDDGATVGLLVMGFDYDCDDDSMMLYYYYLIHSCYDYCYCYCYCSG